MDEATKLLREILEHAQFRPDDNDPSCLRGQLVTIEELCRAAVEALPAAAPRHCSLCSIDDGLVQEWISKVREVAKTKGLYPAAAPREDLPTFGSGTKSAPLPGPPREPDARGIAGSDAMVRAPAAHRSQSVRGDEAAAALAQRNEECEEGDALRERMAGLLRGVANALKGPPAELSSHSWHDLPEIAAALAGIPRDDARAIIQEFVTAWDESHDPTIVGSTCRLIRAEGAMRNYLADTSESGEQKSGEQSDATCDPSKSTTDYDY
jgi:hypothetical protein